MQLRRLDPLANASPYQKLLKNPTKSFSLSEAQFESISANNPELLVTDGDSAVIGMPYRDFLMIYYSFPNLDTFMERFVDLFNLCAEASSKAAAPRGIALSFRDRSNRSQAETLFWSMALEDGPEWVEMTLASVPEQSEPESELVDGYRVREATAADAAAISDLEASAFGLPALSEAGMASLVEDSACLRLIVNDADDAAGYFSLRTEPGGWGVIEELVINEESAEQLSGPALSWAIAWLRNHRSRRMRHEVRLGDSVQIAALQGAGFVPGEAGLIFSQATDRSEIVSAIEERKAHGTRIKFGNWR